MMFEEFLSVVKKIPCRENRAGEENYLEMVVGQDNLQAVVAALDSYFGAPLKPAGQKASREADRYAEPYGGIQSQQTMYWQKKEDRAELAFLWPWGDGTAVTVKIIRE